MRAPSSTTDAVRLRSLDELAAAIPHLLGFHPRDSVVAVALRRDSGRLGLTLRLDLGDPDGDVRLAREIASRMTRAGADAVLLAVYCDRPYDGVEFARERLVDLVEMSLPMPLLDAVLVVGDRCWSYLCVDARCCPDAGRVVRTDSAGALAVAAAGALNGDVVMPDRAALLATVAPVTGDAAASMTQALARARRGRAGDPTVLRRVDLLCRRYDDPPVTLTFDEAARVTVAMHRVPVRDVLLHRLAAGDGPVEQLVRDVARLAQPPHDAPIASVLAAAAYLRGDGVVAAAALERALASDPDYSLALLLSHCLQAQLEPAALRAGWLEEAE